MGLPAFLVYRVCVCVFPTQRCPAFGRSAVINNHCPSFPGFRQNSSHLLLFMSFMLLLLDSSGPALEKARPAIHMLVCLEDILVGFFSGNR